jgi:hypothetical protein
MALLAFAGVLSSQPATAQGGVDDPLGPFQLEGNVTSEGMICYELTSAGAFTATASGGSCPSGFSLITYGTNDDWANVWAGTTHGALAVSTIGPGTTPPEVFNSTASTDNTFFAGGSKDTSGISTGPWLWKLTNTPDKDDIEHAFAAAYVGTQGASTGHTLIYFGMDRFSNSGDQAGGFWFFQDANVNLSNATKGGGSLFSGHHSNNDLLIVSDFSTGGAISTIVAYTWSCTGTGAACDSSGSLTVATVKSYTGENAYIECNPTKGSTPLCAIVNGTGGLAVPFGFTGKSSASGFVSASTYAPGELLEGGVDLNQIFGANIPCFTKFMAETRSSASVSSDLQDLTAPISFPLCSLGISKSCLTSPGTISSDGSSISYQFSATATNTGSGSLFAVTITDTLPDGTVQSFTPTLPDTCSVPGGGTAACLKKNDSVTVSPINFTATTANCHAGVTNCTSPTDVTNTATAKSFTLPSGGDEVDATAPATAECKTSVPNSITVKKACDASNGGATLVVQGSNVVVEVFYTAQVCNTGNSELTNISLVDHHDGNTDSPSPATIASLGPNTCTTVPVSGHYFPSGLDSTTGRFGFTDTISITSATAALGSNPTPPNPNPCATTGGSTTDLSCDTITCPICYDSVCTGKPQPSDF